MKEWNHIPEDAKLDAVHIARDERGGVVWHVGIAYWCGRWWAYDWSFPGPDWFWGPFGTRAEALASARAHVGQVLAGSRTSQ